MFSFLCADAGTGVSAAEVLAITHAVRKRLAGGAAPRVGTRSNRLEIWDGCAVLRMRPMCEGPEEGFAITL